MLCTTRAATPRIGSRVDAAGVARVGIGFTTGSAGIAVVVAGGAWTTGADFGRTEGAIDGITICTAVGTIGGVVAEEDFGIGGVPALGVVASGAVGVVVLVEIAGE